MQPQAGADVAVATAISSPAETACDRVGRDPGAPARPALTPATVARAGTLTGSAQRIPQTSRGRGFRRVSRGPCGRIDVGVGDGVDLGGPRPADERLDLGVDIPDVEVRGQRVGRLSKRSV